MLQSNRSTGFIGNIKNVHRHSLSTIQDNDYVELDYEQHEGKVVRSTVEGNPGTNMLRRKQLSSLKFGSRLSLHAAHDHGWLEASEIRRRLVEELIALICLFLTFHYYQ